MRLYKLPIILFLIGCILFSIPLNGSAEQYLCISELSTGFSYNKVTRSWESTNFIAGNKYVISKSKNGFIVTRLGENEPFTTCKYDFNDVGFLLSSGAMGMEFKFNKINGRFLYTYPIGYFYVLPSINSITDDSSSTPFMEIGKCSPF